MIARGILGAANGIILALGLSQCAAELLSSRAKVQPPPYGPAEEARALLRSGKVDHADRLIRTAREKAPEDARLLCVLGDILFRRADFANAAKAYQSALDLDPSSAHCYLGLGRLAQIEFRRNSARDLLSKAFRLNPDDPEISSAFTRVRAGTQSSAYTMSSAYTKYELNLAGFHPASSSPNGMLVAAKINGRRPLRLVFDTGFSGIIIAAKTAKSLGLEAAPASRIVNGLGEGRPHAAELALAHTVAFEKLEFCDFPIQVNDGPVTPGADGVLGADVFAQFEIKFDARSRRLTLIPFASEAREDAAQPAGPVYGVDHLLLVKTKVNDQKEGLFLLDTAAAFTSVSEEIARMWEHRATVPLMGANGLLSHVFRVAPVKLDFGGHPVIDPAPLALDLRQMSQHIGVEVAGILGYSLLSRSTLTINYRDGIVQLTNDSAR